MDNPLFLTEALEQKFFAARLTAREIDMLKIRCETYQSLDKPDWSIGLIRAYSQYFGFLSALKVKAALREAGDRGYLDVFKDKKISLIDFGAGSLGGTLGAVDYFNHLNPSIKLKDLTLIDEDFTPCDWAQKEFADFLPTSIQKFPSLPSRAKLESSIFLAVDVLNEIDRDEDSQVLKSVENLLDQMTETSLFIFIEPAAKHINQRMLAWRDKLLAKSDRTYNLLLPCTHQKACPALPKKEWCHEDRDYKGPSVYWNLVKTMGFRRHNLSFSMLVFGGQASKFQSQHARVVSRQLHSKGRCDKWLCADGKLWKASLMNRHEKPENEAYFNSRRGHVLDCNSTGLIPND